PAPRPPGAPPRREQGREAAPESRDLGKPRHASPGERGGEPRKVVQPERLGAHAGVDRGAYEARLERGRIEPPRRSESSERIAQHLATLAERGPDDRVVEF